MHEVNDLESRSSSSATHTTPRISAAKRHNLTLPTELHAKLLEAAANEGTSVTDLIKRCLKIGLLVIEVGKTPGAELLIREDGVERRILVT